MFHIRSIAEARPVASWIFIDECPIPQDTNNILIKGEKAVAAYRTIRDVAIFTNRRIIVKDVQGVTGKRIEMYSIPYHSIFMWSTESAGTVDITSEVRLWTKMGLVKISLRRDVDVRLFDRLISTFLVEPRNLD